MTDDVTVTIAADENGLVDCGCSNPTLRWRPCSAGEGGVGYEIEEAEEMPGWDGLWTADDFDVPQRPDDAALSGPEGLAESYNEKARKYGVSPGCSNCYGTMNPKMATHELADRVERDR